MLGIGLRLGGSGPPVAAYRAMPELFAAPTVTFIGASLEAQGAGSGPEASTRTAQYAAALGFAGAIRSYAVSGQQNDGILSRYYAARADNAATAGRNVYIVHANGNDITASRPFPNAEDAIRASQRAIFQAVRAVPGDVLAPVLTSKRLYVSDPAVVQGDAASEAFGSKPYNDAIALPLMREFAPAFLLPGGEAALDGYRVIERHPFLLSSDGIHLEQNLRSRWTEILLALLAARTLGRRPSDSRAGRSMMFRLTGGNWNHLPAAGKTRNELVASGNSFAARLWDGDLDPFVSVGLSSPAFATTGNGAGTFGRLADARFRDAATMTAMAYAEGGATITLVFRNLTPGDRVRVGVAASRASNDTMRRGRYVLNGGEAITVNAANNAASNQGSFAPVTVPPSGELTLTATGDGAGQIAYLNAVILDFEKGTA
ncbi:hypothetical protein QCN27_18100 [Cereibacter sp. SYSU M97828]|nr:hypothetical protein [Cereibacter flavus]